MTYIQNELMTKQQCLEIIPDFLASLDLDLTNERNQAVNKAINNCFIDAFSDMPDDIVNQAINIAIYNCFIDVFNDMPDDIVLTEYQFYEISEQIFAEIIKQTQLDN